MVAIRCSDTLTTAEGERRADVLIAAVPARSWQTISAGAGAHGPREYHWAGSRSALAGSAAAGTGCWPAARSATRPRSPTTPATGPPVQHRRPGLDRGQPLACRGVPAAGQGRGRARPVPSPHLVRPHHLVHARAGLAGGQQGPGGKKGVGTSDAGMIGYTLPEIRRLLISLVQACAPDPGRVWSWSNWRRRRPVPGPAVPLPDTRIRTLAKCQAHRPVVIGRIWYSV